MDDHEKAGFAEELGKMYCAQVIRIQQLEAENLLLHEVAKAANECILNAWSEEVEQQRLQRLIKALQDVGPKYRYGKDGP